jgi:hypothetical protein
LPENYMALCSHFWYLGEINVTFKKGEALRCKIGPTFYQKIMLDIE